MFTFCDVLHEIKQKTQTNSRECKVCLYLLSHHFLLLSAIIADLLHICLAFLRRGDVVFRMLLLLYFLDFQRIKTKGEKRRLDSAKVSIQQVPACKSILVSGLSENTTYDAIRLHFESRRNNGGPVEKVEFVPNSDRAVVVFQDPAGL